jgi:aminopeptidase N
MKFVDPKELFRITIAGTKFYEDFFGVKYPFRKYDQVFVPDMPSKGMENVGCVTYSESLLNRGQRVTNSRSLKSVITYLHELAHMWFGDLVTMKWWNDLWLNESFATYMSFVALTSTPELQNYKYGWAYFLQTKFNGIHSDDMKSSHPIANNIRTSADAKSVFDGISYGKGAAFLKQVHYVLGTESLKLALKDYFSKHQWGNTELQDFVDSLTMAYGKRTDKDMGANFEVGDWSHQWLTQKGVNTLEPVVEYTSAGAIKSLAVRQLKGKRGGELKK